MEIGTLVRVAKRTSPAPGRGKLNIFGPRIAALRMARGWTQLQFALRLQRAGWEIKMSTLGRIESRDRSLTDHELDFLLRVLGCNWTDLVESRVGTNRAVKR